MLPLVCRRFRASLSSLRIPLRRLTSSSLVRAAIFDNGRFWPKTSSYSPSTKSSSCGVSLIRRSASIANIISERGSSLAYRT